MQIHFHRHLKREETYSAIHVKNYTDVNLPVYVIYKLDSVKHFCYPRIIHSNLDKVRTV